MCRGERGGRKRVNWICAIIISMFLKNAITIQLTMSVPLQFCACLKNAIMYARSRRWPTCRRIRGAVYSYRQYCSSHSISLSSLTCGTHTSGLLQPPTPPLPAILSLIWRSQPPSGPPHHRTGRRADAAAPSSLTRQAPHPTERRRVKIHRPATGAGAGPRHSQPEFTRGWGRPRPVELARNWGIPQPMEPARGRDWSLPAAGWPLEPEAGGAGPRLGDPGVGGARLRP
jgi:hypothetical protein